MPAAELVVDDVAGHLFARGEVRARQSLGVDAPAVGEYQEVVEDEVVRDDVVGGVVGHAGQFDLVQPATPADGDSAIGQVVDLIVGDEGPLGVAHQDRDAAVEFRGDVGEMIVQDLVVAGDLGRVRLRQVHAAEFDAVGGDVGEDATFHPVLLRQPLGEFEAGTAQMY